MTDINFLLFNDFETLDAFGPAEILSGPELPYRPVYCSLSGGLVASRQGVAVETVQVDGADSGGILLVPGGQGTRRLVNDPAFLRLLGELATAAPYVLTVCTGAALLAATGLLDGRRATSNKCALDWVRSVGPGVHWVPRARWVTDGKFYTSSGVSAGMDMALGFIRDRHGATAWEIANRIEYRWNGDANDDPFFSEEL